MEQYNPYKRFEEDKVKYSKMTLKEAKDLIGDRARWELLNMRKALSSMPLMNTSEENQRLVAVNKVLKSMKR